MLISGHIFYAIYLGLTAILLLVSLSHIYHGIRFGGTDPIAIATTGMFIAGIVVIVWLTMSWLSNVDWNKTVSLTAPSFSSPHLTLPPN